MTDTAKPAADAAPQASEFEKKIAEMTPEQIERVTNMVQQENDKRNDPMKRLGSMHGNEANKLVRDRYGFNPGW